MSIHSSNSKMVRGLYQQKGSHMEKRDASDKDGSEGNQQVYTLKN